MKLDPATEQLIAGYFAGTLDAEAMGELERWLSEDDDRIDIFVRYAAVEQGLVTISRHEVASDLMAALVDGDHDLIASGPDDAPANPHSDASDRAALAVARGPLQRKHGFKFPHGLAYAALAASLLLAVLLMSDILPSRSVVTPPVEPPNSQAQAPPTPLPRIQSAKFLNTHNAVYETTPVQGDAGQGQSIRLSEGIAELEFDEGARVVVDAPTLFRPLGPDAVQLESGKLTATVPQHAYGFRVHTPNLIFTDAGAVFGIDVEPTGELVAAVLHGEVRVRHRLGGAVITLTEGQFIEADDAGTIGEVQSLPASVSSMLFSRTLEDAVSPHGRYSRSVLNDGPLLYWRFEELAARRVTNSEGTPSRDGAMFGGTQQVEGLLGKGVRFRGSMKNTGGIESIGQLLDRDETAYTLELWVKPDRVHHACVAALLQKPAPGQTMFQHQGFIEVLGDNRWLKGQPANKTALRFLHRSPMSPNIDEGQNLWPTQRYQPEQWMLLTAVKSEQTISLYFNGERIAQQRDDQSVDGSVQLLIGSAGVSHKLDAWNIRPFDGVIDEVAVYGHALTAEQIKQRHALGIEALQQDR